jgi:hypothetical protein
MNLGINDIVPEALHRKVGWDIRHHFMAEKVIDRFGLVLPRDRELIRQLAVVYVLDGRTAPPEADETHTGMPSPGPASWPRRRNATEPALNTQVSGRNPGAAFSRIQKRT